MYDDASYYAFMPSAAPQEDRQATPKHKRRQSSLQQPNVSCVLLFVQLVSDFSDRKTLKLIMTVH